MSASQPTIAAIATAPGRGGVGVIRHSYAAQLNGEDGADKIIRNSLVPDNFVQSGGKNFGDIAQAELVNYGDQWKGVELVDGKDTIYNPDKAKASFEKAKKELEAKGVTFPIHLDVPVEQTDTACVQQRMDLSVQFVPIPSPA